VINGRKTIIVGAALLVSGLTLNYCLERRTVLAVWENSGYSVGWVDLIYPPICFFLSLAGSVLVVTGAISRVTIRQLLWYGFLIVIPLTILYTLWSFGMQFIATGADRLGECPGLYQAAMSTNLIPTSQWKPGYPSLGCEVQRRGMSLSYYNSVGVHGVTDAAQQQLILDRVAAYARQVHTHAVRVMFYEKEIWSVDRQTTNGTTSGKGSPSRLIRVVNVG
jgi:hypothetical protein